MPENRSSPSPYSSLGVGAISAALRALSLGSKFVLMVAMAKVLPVDDVGKYGLLVATVGFAMTFLGFEFYTYSSRDLLSKPLNEWPAIIRDQLIFYLLAYLVLLPLVLLVFVTARLPWELCGWFFLILALEHFAQESYRLLVVYGRPLVAAWTLFFRYGVWAYALSVAFLMFPDWASLGYVWLGWVLGCSLSIALAAWSLRMLDWRQPGRISVDWLWVKRGVRVAVPFLLSALALRGLFTVDRYLLDYFHGLKSVGYYSFYMGLAFALNSFVDSGVLMVHYPKIVASYRRGDLLEYRKLMKLMTRSIGVVFGLFSLSSYFVVPILLETLERPLYANHLPSFWLLLLAIGIYCFSLVPHMGLYVRHADMSIMVVMIGALFVFVVSGCLFIPPYGLMGVAFSQIFTMIFVFFCKAAFLYRCR